MTAPGGGVSPELPVELAGDAPGGAATETVGFLAEVVVAVPGTPTGGSWLLVEQPPTRTATTASALTTATARPPTRSRAAYDLRRCRVGLISIESDFGRSRYDRAPRRLGPGAPDDLLPEAEPVVPPDPAAAATIGGEPPPRGLIGLHGPSDRRLGPLAVGRAQHVQTVSGACDNLGVAPARTPLPIGGRCGEPTVAIPRIGFSGAFGGECRRSTRNGDDSRSH